MKRCVESGVKKPIAKFNPHDGHNCLVCVQARKGRPTLKAPKSYNQKELDQKFKIYGFSKYTQGTSSSDLIYYKPRKIGNDLTTDILVKISEDGGWLITSLGREFIKSNLPSHETLPDLITNKNINDFMETINQFQVCHGNADFPDVVENRVNVNVPFPDSFGGIYLYNLIFA